MSKNGVKEAWEPKQIARLVWGLCDDPNLYDDLFQEALLCRWEAEISSPGRTARWYRQRCWFHVHDYLRRGRSVDSCKRSRSGSSLDGSVEADVISRNDVLQEIYERDALEALMLRLSPAEQRTLQLLWEGMTIREVARELHISHVAVIARRRQIAATAVRLGIHH